MEGSVGEQQQPSVIIRSFGRETLQGDWLQGTHNFRTYRWIEENSKWRRRGHWFPENCSGFISHGVVNKIYTKPCPVTSSSLIFVFCCIVPCVFLPLSPGPFGSVHLKGKSSIVYYQPSVLGMHKHSHPLCVFVGTFCWHWMKEREL